jgi:hypothetical protein
MQTYGGIDSLSSNKCFGDIDAKSNRIYSEGHIKMMAE